MGNFDRRRLARDRDSVNGAVRVWAKLGGVRHDAQFTLPLRWLAVDLDVPQHQKAGRRGDGDHRAAVSMRVKARWRLNHGDTPGIFQPRR